MPNVISGSHKRIDYSATYLNSAEPGLPYVVVVYIVGKEAQKFEGTAERNGLTPEAAVRKAVHDQIDKLA